MTGRCRWACWRTAVSIAAETFTLTQEYVPDARAAIRLLDQQPAIDPHRIFVLGHSAGLPGARPGRSGRQRDDRELDRPSRLLALAAELVADFHQGKAEEVEAGPVFW